MRLRGSKQMGFGLKTAIILSAVALFVPNTARAVTMPVTTPQQYCSGVSGCEVLNYTAPSVGIGNGLLIFVGVSYCRGGKFNYATFYSDGSANYYMRQSDGTQSSTTIITQEFICANIK